MLLARPTQTEPIYTLRREICGGLFVYFSADHVVNFAKNCKTERKATVIVLQVQNQQEKKKHSALSQCECYLR